MSVLFILLFSLLLIHEMDAIRTKEWKMFIVLKDMADEKAYKIFTLVHIPLYFAVIFIMAQGASPTVLYYVTDIFLIGHTIIHNGFKKHPGNGFTSAFSKAIIYSLGFLAVIHLCLLLFAV